MKYQKLCPICLSFVHLDKRGLYYRHGFRAFKQNGNETDGFKSEGYNVKQTRPACKNSGQRYNEPINPTQ